MKILVVADVTPFVRDDVASLADQLILALKRAGHEAESAHFPRGTTPAHLVSSIVSASLLQVVNVDRVIGLTFPAYLVPHPDVVVWLAQERLEIESLPDSWRKDPMSEPAARAVGAAARAALEESTRFYTTSTAVANLLHHSTTLTAEVLPAPVGAEEDLLGSPPDPAWDRVVMELTR